MPRAVYELLYTYKAAWSFPGEV